MTSLVQNLAELDRFLSKVDRSGGIDACWPWMRATNGKYGTIRLAGKGRYAHRVAFLLATDVEPGNLSVCHTCDNPLCCNPKHLWLGTQQQNLDDAKSKGRMASGVRHGLRLHPEACGLRKNPALAARGERVMNSKLTAKQVRVILGAPQYRGVLSHFARMYGTTPTTIKNVRDRRTWKHIKE